MALHQHDRHRVSGWVPMIVAMLALILVAFPAIAHADSSPSSAVVLVPSEIADVSASSSSSVSSHASTIVDTVVNSVADELERDATWAVPDLENPQVVKIDGSFVMTSINQSLKRRFEQEFPGTEVTVEANGTESALESLLSEEIDLAAIGRSLTPAEKAQGLVEVPVSQDRIAIIIGRSNPFRGHLTLEQFAKIFRGEITDWAEVGGVSGPIRLIDRPAYSETRLTLSQSGILTPGELVLDGQGVRLETDDTAEVIRQLGMDGISYAIASQVEGQRRVKFVKMAVLLDTLPTDELYPYAQIRGYAYKKTSEAAVLPFVNFATGEPGQSAIMTAKLAESKAVAQALKPRFLAKLPSTNLAPTSSGSSGEAIATDAIAAGNNANVLPILLWGMLPLSLLLLFFARRQSSLSGVSGVDDSSITTESRGDSAFDSTATSPPSAPAPPAPIPAPEPPPTSPSAGDGRMPSEVTVTDYGATATADEGISAPPVDLSLFELSIDDEPPIDDESVVTADEGVAVSGADVPETDTQLNDSVMQVSVPPPLPESESVPLTVQELYDQGWTRLDATQYTNALNSFEQALASDAALSGAWIGKGKALLNLGRYDEAIASFDQGIAGLTSQDVSTVVGGAGLVTMAWLNRGQAQLKAGQTDAALNDINQAITLDTASVDAWIAKGDVLLSLGQTDDAQASYAEAARLRGDRLALSRVTDVVSPVIPTSDLQPPVPTLEPRSTEPRSAGTDSGLETDVETELVVPSAQLTPSDVQVPIPVPDIALRRPPGEGTVSAGTMLLDLVVLVNTQAPLHDEVQAMAGVVDAAIASAASGRSADTRITWLGTQSSWEGTPVQYGVSDYLRYIGNLPEADLNSLSRLISAVAQQFDWRPGAAQSLLYMGNEVMSSGEQLGITPVMQAVKSSGITVNTYFAKAKSPCPDIAEAEYTQLAQVTGGLAFTDQSTAQGFQSVLDQVVEGGCRFCIHRRLTIHSQRDCYELDQEQMGQLQTAANATVLSPGSYIVRIKNGAFSYWANNHQFDPEPWVLLWIYGGRFVNQKTNVEVGATWMALNGYDDALKLQVLEATTLCALFLDTYKDDNSGQITLSILTADD